MWAAIVNKRGLTTRHHSQKLPVDLLLLFTHRLDKQRRTMKSNHEIYKETQQLNEKKPHVASSTGCLTSCAVQRGLALSMRPDEVLCVGLCITLMGNVFSYMLVQELLAEPIPVQRLQTQNESLVIYRQQFTDKWYSKRLRVTQDNSSKNTNVRNTSVSQMVGGLGVCRAVETVAVWGWQRGASWLNDRLFLAPHDV